MTKLVVTSDLHYDPRGDLTEPDAIRALAQEIQRAAPDVLVLAGDLAHGRDNFAACLALFDGVCAKTGVLVGNHDVWYDKAAGLDSRALLEEALPAATREAGFVWLEDAVIRAGAVAVAGSCAWYDYSAIDPRFMGTHTPGELSQLKGMMNNDAHWVNWPWDDVEVAARMQVGLEARLDELERDDAVARVAVVTHVPHHEEQMVRSEDDRWALSNAYFGNLTIGAMVKARDKVRAVVSGHTHHGRRAKVAGLDVRVVDSDYGAPGFEALTL